MKRARGPVRALLVGLGGSTLVIGLVAAVAPSALAAPRTPAGRTAAAGVSASSITRSAPQPSQFASSLTRAPYLTDLVGLNVAVNFATDQSGKSASLSYGAVDATGTCSLSSAAAASRISIKVGTVSQYQWKVKLALPSAGVYCYRAYLGNTDLLGSNSSPQFATQIPVGSTLPFSFAVLGDWGQVDATGNNTDQANLLSQIASSGVQFAVTVGDNGYPNGSQINYGDLRQTGSGTSAIFGPNFWTVAGTSVPLFTAAGNHGLSGPAHTDITTWTQDNAVAGSGGRYQNDTYCCTNGSKSANYASEWYAFDAGNARFYVLDSAWGDTNGGTASPYANDAAAHFAPGTPEYTWLLNDLKTHPTQLKFAFSHYPFYSDSKTESSDTFLQGAANLEGLLGQYGVQIAFNGHAHFYERNTPSAPGMPVTYVTGGGGGTLEPIGPTCGSYDAYGIGWSPTKLKGYACGAATPPVAASQVFHFLKVTVDGTTVTVAPTDENGNVFDTQTYSFPDAPVDSTPPSVPGSLTAAALSPFSVALSWSPSTDDVGVSGYDLYRNGLLYQSLPAVAGYTDSSVLASSTYTYAVRARDASGNVSDPTAPSSVTTPAAPLPLFADGFESGDLTAWTTQAGLAVEGTTVAHGAWAVEGNTTNGATYAKKTLPSTYADAYSRVLFNIQSQTSQINLLRLRTAAGASLGYVYVATSGQLGYRNDVTGTSTLSSVVPSPGWHALELHVGIGTTGVVEVWLDGAAVPELTSPVVNTGSVAVGGMQIGETTTGRTYDVVFDDAAFGTSRLGPAPDTTAPTAPATVTASATGPSVATIGWSAATDDVGVVGYDVFRDGALLVSAGNVLSWTDTTVAPGSTHQYGVRARDGAGNVSALPVAPSLTMPAASAPPVFADGFESGNLNAWTSKGGLVAESGVVRTGSFAVEGNTTTGATYAKKSLPGTYMDAYAGVAFLVKSQVSQLNLLRLRDASGNSIGYLYLSPSGTLAFHSDASNSNLLSTVAPGAGWHTLQLHVVINGTASTVQVSLDGTALPQLSTSTANLGTAAVGGFQIGETTTGRTYDVVFDDAAFDTSPLGF